MYSNFWCNRCAECVDLVNEGNYHGRDIGTEPWWACELCGSDDVEEYDDQDGEQDE